MFYKLDQIDYVIRFKVQNSIHWNLFSMAYSLETFLMSKYFR